jgi:hypothetical protein
MWIGKCIVKRGFFVLRDCGKQAMNACSFCSRAVCQEHSLMRGQTLVCLDCNARQQQLTDEEKFNQMTGDATQNRSGLYTYRHGYYSQGGYSPFYSGFYYSSYYDTYDTRAFTRRETDVAFDGDDSSSIGFLDS